MQLNLDINNAAFSIKAYEPGKITVRHPLVDPNSPGAAITRDSYGRAVVREEVFSGSLVIMPDRIIRDWAPRNFDELRAEHLQGLAGLGLEVVLLGTGSRLRFPDFQYSSIFFEQGTGIEVMDTYAACRTYNVLMSEGRRVAAALIDTAPPA